MLQAVEADAAPKTRELETLLQLTASNELRQPKLSERTICLAQLPEIQ